MKRDANGDFAAGSVTVAGDVNLPATSGAATGVIKQNGSPFLHSYGTGNTFTGFTAGNFTMTGANNTGYGKNALNDTSSGYNNTAVGNDALTNLSTAIGNTAIGSYSLQSVSSGSQNTAVGVRALDVNSTGASNVGIGFKALEVNNGTANVALGALSLQNHSAGNNNVGIGTSSLLNHTSGTGNIALGTFAGQNLTTGSNNIAIGNQGVAGESNIIRIGTAGTQTDTFLTGVIHGDGSGLTGITATSLAAGSITDVDISNGAGITVTKIGGGSVSNTEFGYLNGVTSPIQSQLSGISSTANSAQSAASSALSTANSAQSSASSALSQLSGKAPLASPNFTGTATGTFAGGGAGLTGLNAANMGSGSVSNTEFGYLNGVTSPIQGQLSGISSTASSAQSAASSAQSAASSAQSAASNAQSAANSAQSTASSAQSSANSALSQLSGKAPLASPNFTGTATGTFAGGGAGLTGLNATNMGSGSVSNTEFGYLNGVTSPIQSQLSGISSTASSAQSSANSALSQLSGKAPLASPTFSGAVTLPIGSSSSAPLKLRVGTNLLTTPTVGALEFDGTSLYFTIDNGGAERKTLAYSDGTITTSSLVDGAVTASKLGADVGLWSVNGADVYRNSGNVGIGTTTPAKPLHVLADGSASAPFGGPGPSGAAAGDGNTSAVFDRNGHNSVYINAGNGRYSAIVFGRPTSANNASISYSDYLGSGMTLGVPGGNITLENGGQVGIGTTTPSYQLQLSTDSAAKPNGGSWANSSDRRLKRNITTMPNALENLQRLRGVNFEWVNPEDHANQNGPQGGFIAQEVEAAFPGWVTEVDAAEHDRALTDNGKIKSMSLPFEFDALVVNAIKEQQAQIAEIEDTDRRSEVEGRGARRETRHHRTPPAQPAATRRPHRGREERKVTPSSITTIMKQSSMYLVALARSPSLIRGRAIADPATLDSGGGRTTDGTVVNDGSLGGIADISSAGAAVAKHGYIGQLTEVTALQLAATPNTVNEGGNRQLSVMELLDDDSTTALAATDVAWSVASGPLPASTPAASPPPPPSIRTLPPSHKATTPEPPARSTSPCSTPSRTTSAATPETVSTTTGSSTSSVSTIPMPRHC